MRYDKQQLEKDLLLYAVTDRSWLDGQTLAQQTEEALKGGVTFVQIREKDLCREEFSKEARELKALCQAYAVPFVVNDDVELAMEVDADGVHVGQSDMEAGRVREKLGPDKIIGVSARTVEEALLAQERGADYLGVGAVFHTSSKADAADVSFQTLREICRAVDIPVIAIGGITRENVTELAGSGICGVAVISAIFASPDRRKAAEELKAAVQQAVAQLSMLFSDIDGTLLDSLGIWEEADERYLMEQGIRPEKDLGRILYPMTMQEACAYIRKHYPVKDTESGIAASILKIVEVFYQKEAPLKEGAAGFLRSLSQEGLPIIAATTGEKELADAAFRRLGIRQLFREILTCTQIGAGKDRPKIYEEAARLMGSRPEETLVFEDAFYAVKTAAAAGFVTVGVRDPYNDEDKEKIIETADYYLEDLTDFPGFRETLRASGKLSG